MSRSTTLATKKRHDCGCECSGCNNARDSGFGHCENRENGCHFNEEITSSKKRPRHRSRSQRRQPPREVPSPHPGGERWQLPAETGEGDICRYKVVFTLHNPFDETDVGSPVVIRDTTLFAPDERVAVEAALKKLAISWQGSNGTRGACGVGPNAYLIFDPASMTHVLSWGYTKAGAKVFADMADARYCHSVVVEKISPTEK
ncbi:MAG: hypothetical protein V1719_02000 [Patescibacteria group bacterium]